MNNTQLSEFNRWYTTFPNKVSVGNAKRKWEQINPDPALVDKMIEAVKDQTEQYIADKGQQRGAKAWKYFPGPAPWLNAESWDNVVEKDKKYVKNEKICICGQPATNKGKMDMWQCADCWDGGDPERAEMLKQHFINLGIKQVNGEWRESCMKAMRSMSLGKLIGGLK